MASLVYLGFSVLIFIISFGLIWYFAPIIFGTVFSTIEGGNMLNTIGCTEDNITDIRDGLEVTDDTWCGKYSENKELALLLTPLAASLGVIVFCIKVGMVASVVGREK